MRLTPRKEEVDRVVEILTSDKYKTPEAMAKDVIKATADMLGMREWWAACIEDEAGTRSPTFGPFTSSIDATATFKKTGLGGTVLMAKVNSAGMLLANAEGKPGWPGFCANPQCGHFPAAHAVKGSGRGKCRYCDRCPEFQK